nr:hypothetical protein [Roseburia inulinivorans]
MDFTPCVRERSPKFFNGHTNITDSSFLTFGVKGLLQASKNVKDAMLFNVLSYMSNELLTNGHTAACIDEFLSVPYQPDRRGIYPKLYETCA